MNFDDLFQAHTEYSNRVDGVMVAIVTNNEDPEKLARVKLKLPILDGEHETDWARIATFMAGKDRGSLFIPEVGDVVLVAFHMGDIREPFVIGMLWNTDQPSPEAGKDNNIRKIKSREGHEIIFGDDAADGKITIKTKKGQIVELMDKTDIIKIAEKSGNNSIEIKGGSANEITIKSSTSKITMNAKGDISIESSKAIKIKSTQVQIEASAQLSLKAGAALDIKSDGMITIKGSLVKIN
ncbi:hypothetical protein EHS13_18045 [Paenibacillus psychroresistens]|uniref:Gp5/Type VI secretion system Vgr protein OB-fold domain-containing protein n=1 Tax=Paenibacillus psychroresistens TaxID=1778678 RepID=A0A6B8RLW1_9BACL|nr:phage baseplate assembly protein V [Paenibacillus psychroresistens]QGQ96642.1 hypothetical protein EHS13_18045 [Paenibacillus psychroresistens]